jgi:hypothetical protein
MRLLLPLALAAPLIEQAALAQPAPLPPLPPSPPPPSTGELEGTSSNVVSSAPGPAPVPAPTSSTATSKPPPPPPDQAPASAPAATPTPAPTPPPVSAAEPPLTASEDAPSSQSSGPFVGLGLGYQTPGLGGELGYYIEVPGAGVYFAPYGGIGDFSVGTATGATVSLVGFAGGVMFTLRPHHWGGFADLGYGLGAVDTSTTTTGSGTVTATGTNITSSTTTSTTKYYGVSIAVGGEYMADNGFFLRASLGAKVLVNCDICSKGIQQSALPAIALAVGVKLKL